MHFKGREARFPMLVWPGIKDLEVRSKEEVERKKRTEPIAPNYPQSKRKKSKDSPFPHTHIGGSEKERV